MSVKLQIDGLSEFREALRQLPYELREEAGAIVLAIAEQAGQQIPAAYPQGPTGNLKRRVTVTKEPSSAFGVRAVVKSRAPHASIFEFGTGPRQNRAGANRGVMPPAPHDQAFIPIAIQARRRMVQALIQMLQRAGLVVTQS